MATVESVQHSLNIYKHNNKHNVQHSVETYAECTDMHMCSTNCYKHNVVSVHQIGVIRGTNILAVAIVISCEQSSTT